MSTTNRLGTSPHFPMTHENITQPPNLPTWIVFPDLELNSKKGMADHETEPEGHERALNDHEQTQSHAKRPRSTSPLPGNQASNKKLRRDVSRHSNSDGSSHHNDFGMTPVNELEAALNRSFAAAASSSGKVYDIPETRLKERGLNARGKAPVQAQLPSSWFKIKLRIQPLSDPRVKSAGQVASTSKLDKSPRDSAESSKTPTHAATPLPERPLRPRRAKVGQDSASASASASRRPSPANKEATLKDTDMEDWMEAAVEPSVFTGGYKYAKDWNLESDVMRFNLRHLLSTEGKPSTKVEQPGPGYTVAVPEVPRSVQCKALIKGLFQTDSQVPSRDETLDTKSLPPSDLDGDIRMDDSEANSAYDIPFDSNPHSRNITPPPSLPQEQILEGHTAAVSPIPSVFARASCISPFARHISEHDPNPLIEQPPPTFSPTLSAKGLSTEPPSADDSSNSQSLDGLQSEQRPDNFLASPQRPPISSVPNPSGSPIAELEAPSQPVSVDSQTSEEVIEIISPSVLELHTFASLDTFTPTAIDSQPSASTSTSSHTSFDVIPHSVQQPSPPAIDAMVVDESHYFAASLIDHGVSNPSFDDVQQAEDVTSAETQAEFEVVENDYASVAPPEADECILEEKTPLATHPGNLNTTSTECLDLAPQLNELPDLEGVNLANPAEPSEPVVPRANHSHLIGNWAPFIPAETSIPYTPIPTIFETGSKKSRPRDSWALDENISELQTWVDSQYVIAPMLLEFECPEVDNEDEADAEEIDELQEDDELDLIPPSSPSLRPISTRTLRSGHAAEERRMSEESEPQTPTKEGLAAEMELWSAALQSLLKGKKKFQQQDMVDLQKILQSIYANREHIPRDSVLANTVLTVANLPVSDVPFADKIGLRAEARKSVRAWGLKKITV
ncbi:hypothetical protein CPC08DRAFT_706026 [Agrocybe pediades]|nr:hypothetical protein CPC08DRAFT_706026 [Agrocybe pediades]